MPSSSEKKKGKIFDIIGVLTTEQREQIVAAAMAAGVPSGGNEDLYSRARRIAQKLIKQRATARVAKAELLAQLPAPADNALAQMHFIQITPSPDDIAHCWWYCVEEAAKKEILEVHDKLQTRSKWYKKIRNVLLVIAGIAVIVAVAALIAVLIFGSGGAAAIPIVIIASILAGASSFSALIMTGWEKLRRIFYDNRFFSHRKSKRDAMHRPVIELEQKEFDKLLRQNPEVAAKIICRVTNASGKKAFESIINMVMSVRSRLDIAGSDNFLRGVFGITPPVVAGAALFPQAAPVFPVAALQLPFGKMLADEERRNNFIVELNHHICDASARVQDLRTAAMAENQEAVEAVKTAITRADGGTQAIANVVTVAVVQQAVNDAAGGGQTAVQRIQEVITAGGAGGGHNAIATNNAVEGAINEAVRTVTAAQNATNLTQKQYADNGRRLGLLMLGKMFDTFNAAPMPIKTPAGNDGQPEVPYTRDELVQGACAMLGSSDGQKLLLEGLRLADYGITEQLPAVGVAAPAPVAPAPQHPLYKALQDLWDLNIQLLAIGGGVPLVVPDAAAQRTTAINACANSVKGVLLGADQLPGIPIDRRTSVKNNTYRQWFDFCMEQRMELDTAITSVRYSFVGRHRDDYVILCRYIKACTGEFEAAVTGAAGTDARNAIVVKIARLFNAVQPILPPDAGESDEQRVGREGKNGLRANVLEHLKTAFSSPEGKELIGKLCSDQTTLRGFADAIEVAAPAPAAGAPAGVRPLRQVFLEFVQAQSEVIFLGDIRAYNRELDAVTMDEERSTVVAERIGSQTNAIMELLVNDSRRRNFEAALSSSEGKELLGKLCFTGGRQLVLRMLGKMFADITGAPLFAGVPPQLTKPELAQKIRDRFNSSGGKKFLLQGLGLAGCGVTVKLSEVLQDIWELTNGDNNAKRTACANSVRGLLLATNQLSTSAKNNMYRHWLDFCVDHVEVGEVGEVVAQAVTAITGIDGQIMQPPTAGEVFRGYIIACNRELEAIPAPAAADEHAALLGDAGANGRVAIVVKIGQLTNAVLTLPADNDQRVALEVAFASPEGKQLLGKICHDQATLRVFVGVAVNAHLPLEDLTPQQTALLNFMQARLNAAFPQGVEAQQLGPQPAHAPGVDGAVVINGGDNDIHQPAPAHAPQLRGRLERLKLWSNNVSWIDTALENVRVLLPLPPAPVEPPVEQHPAAEPVVPPPAEQHPAAEPVVSPPVEQHPAAEPVVPQPPADPKAVSPPVGDAGALAARGMFSANSTPSPSPVIPEDEGGGRTTTLERGGRR